MGLEGGIAIVAGVVAGSVALIGFGIDSGIEGIASVVIIWRFSGSRIHSDRAEHRAQQLVAVQFFLLAPYVAFEAIQHLAAGDRPEISALGMVLTATSVIGMPLLGIAKQRVARTLGSQATHGEGTQNLLCAYLAATVFLGLPETPCSGGGGWMRSRLSSSPASPFARGCRPGGGRDVAPPPICPRAPWRVRTTAAELVPGDAYSFGGRGRPINASQAAAEMSAMMPSPSMTAAKPPAIPSAAPAR